jgi:hypothetical protein
MLGLFFLGMIVTVIFFMVLFHVMELESQQENDNATQD